MSLRGILIGSTLLVTVLAATVLGVLGVQCVTSAVRHEAQERVDYDLQLVATRLREQSQRLADQAEQCTAQIDPEDVRALPSQLEDLKKQLGLTLLNLCNRDGVPMAGDYPDDAATVSSHTDPILQQAQAGTPAHGIMEIDRDRLLREAGPRLAASLTLVDEKHPDAAAAAQQPLFIWFAVPVRNPEGAIVALLYGGRALNRDHALVDSLRDLVFGTRRYDGKPIGTLTIFSGPFRAATNVVTAEGRRAVGTRVSEEVEQRVLVEGLNWHDRALVVDSWYVSAYQPLRDPEDRVIGMLYVGLLDAPYAAVRDRLITPFLLVIAVTGLVVFLLGTTIVNRILRPVDALCAITQRIADGEWSATLTPTRSYRELNRLQDDFVRARHAVADRDAQLRSQNRTLRETNQELDRVNHNYMEMLGFVTHELKSPLSAMQSMINVILDGYVGEVSEPVRGYLDRVNRNCETLQERVRGYLDLSRLEQGLLTVHDSVVECRRDIIDPAVHETGPLFDSSGIELSVRCPDELTLRADPELVRVVLVNLLSNVSKYANANSRASLKVHVRDNEVLFEVRNEGPGFTAAEQEQLFKQFSRLKNTNTRSKKGSGVGLFLCRQIVDLHGGRISADSEPGQWACFTFALPRKTQRTAQTSHQPGAAPSSASPSSRRSAGQSLEHPSVLSDRNHETPPPNLSHP